MVTFATDHIFHIGSMHLHKGEPCQDYALSGLLDGAAFAVVSDGCTNGGMTDIGSRLICLAAQQSISDFWTRYRDVDMTTGVDYQQQLLLGSQQKTLGLAMKDLLATSVYAVVAEQGATIQLCGDGVIALLDNAGQLTLTKLEWDQNAPFYPAYSDKHLPDFIKLHGGDLKAATATVETWWGGDEESLTLMGTADVSLEEGIAGYTMSLSADDVANLRYIAVFTDGVTQVDGLTWQAAVCELLAFKSTQGLFAKRRMARFLKDNQTLTPEEQSEVVGSISRPRGKNPVEWEAWAVKIATAIRLAEAKKGPVDDIGYAVIQIIPPEEEA